MSNKLECIGLNENKLKWIIGTHSHWKIKILGAVSELPAKQPIWPIFMVNRLIWQFCLADSSKTAPRIMIFSMVMGADYSFELIFIETHTPLFNGHKELFLGSVWYIQ